MEGYYLLDSDDEKVYRIYHKNRGEKSISKAGLSKETASMIDSLPKLSSGGKVEKSSYQQMMEDASAKRRAEQAEKESDFKSQQEMEDIIAQEEADIRMQKSIERGKASQLSGIKERADATSGMEQWVSGLPAVPGTSRARPYSTNEPAPALESEAQQPQPYSSVNAPTGKPLEKPLEKPLTEAERLYRDESELKEEAVLGQYNAEKMVAEQTEGALKDYDAKLNKAIGTYQSEMKNAINEYNTLQNKMADGTIDPNRYWKNAGWGGLVGAALSVAHSGFSAGIMGQAGNPAIDIINKEIERDIEAQKAEIDKTKNLLSLNLDKRKNLTDAIRETRSMLWSSVEHKAKIAVAQAGTLEAKAKAQNSLALIKEKQRQILDERAAKEAEKAFFGGAGNAAAIPEKLRDNAVILPDGSYGVVLSKESKKPVEEAVAAYHEGKDIAKEYDEFVSKGKTWSLTERQAKADSLHERGVFAIKNLANLGVLSGDEAKRADNILPTTSAFMQGNQQAKLEEFNNYIRSMVDSKLKSRVVNYKPQQSDTDKMKEYVRANINNKSDPQKQARARKIMEQFGITP